MSCIRPITLKSGDVVPCGHCNTCLQLRRMDWCFRLTEEQAVSHSAYFLSMTYADDKLPQSGDLFPRHVELFLKRVRSYQDRLYDGLTPVRYYAVGEYGEETLRPHYHAIIFNVIPEVANNLRALSGTEDGLWPHGHVHVGTVTGQSIGYVTSYVLYKWNHPGREPPFARMSRRPGLGLSYLTPSNINFHQYGQVDFVSRNSRRAHMPRYYRDRLFSAEERVAFRKAALLEQSRSYDIEIDRLSKLHRDPYRYHDELARYRDDLIVSKLNLTL